MYNGQGFHPTGRAHQVEYSVLVQQEFLGTARSRDQLHSVQQKQSRWWLVKQIVRLSG